MKLESLRLQNFKAFRQVEITDLPQFCVFVGHNGAGKSTIFSVFEFLKEAMASNVNAALCQCFATGGAEPESSGEDPLPGMTKLQRQEVKA